MELKIYGEDSLLIKLTHSSKVNFASESGTVATKPRSGGPRAGGCVPPAGEAAPLGGAGGAENEGDPGRARDVEECETSRVGAGARQRDAECPIS